MDRSNQPQLVWRKSTLSGGSGDNCVEVADLPDGGALIRDTKNRAGGELHITPGGWRTFLSAVKASSFE
ncbi:DUF397 domain-containing protein [Streptosporangium sp. NPDC049078]|uniref:DUF397 domain-containing protein n=1 Tax=Streptosporangium sp. NPDC049078 TaxID=3155767 RepID=UPI00344004DF